MARVFGSAIIAAPIARVWALIRDFNGHESWHPAVARSRIEADEPADKVGAVRRFRLRGGGEIREQLLALSDRDRSFRYFIVEAPVALRDYVAEMRLKPVTGEDATFCEWRAEFDPPPAERDGLTRFVRDEIIAAGFAAIRRALESDAPPSPRFAPTLAQGEARAVVIARYGGPETLELRGLAVPPPGPGELRLRQTAIGVNFIDVYCRRGSFTLVPPGGVPGMEAAGVVENIGPGVTGLSLGDRVAYACAPPGAYATARNMRADMLVKLPPALTDRQAASLLLKGMTASFLLHDVYAVKRGDVVMVHAAAGGVGQLLCRWAKALGAAVVGVVSTPAKADIARTLGCDLVLLSDQPDLVEATRRFANGEGVQAVYDAVGADTFDRSVACLASRGHLISFGQASGDVGARSIDQLASRSVTLSRPNYSHYTDTAAKLAAQSSRLFAALAAGFVEAAEPRVYPLAEASRAHADLEGRRTTGAIVLTP
jgi:NADPH:quinone reductase-like Zn-dependent oxidoreductase